MSLESLESEFKVDISFATTSDAMEKFGATGSALKLFEGLFLMLVKLRWTKWGRRDRGSIRFGAAFFGDAKRQKQVSSEWQGS